MYANLFILVIGDGRAFFHVVIVSTISPHVGKVRRTRVWAQRFSPFTLFVPPLPEYTLVEPLTFLTLWNTRLKASRRTHLPRLDIIHVRHLIKPEHVILSPEI